MNVESETGLKTVVPQVWCQTPGQVRCLTPLPPDTTAPGHHCARTPLCPQFGPPPFGTLLSAHAHPSTLENWGEDSWVTLHQTGNMREHNNYWYLTEIFSLPSPQPALNGQPYDSGFADPRHKVKRVRARMYGGFLSGGFAGHVYGAGGADIEPAAPT